MYRLGGEEFRERCSELHEKDFSNDEKEKLLRLTEVEMRREGLKH